MAEEPRMEVLRQSSRRYGQFLFMFFYLPVCFGRFVSDTWIAQRQWQMVAVDLFIVNLWWIRRQDANQEVKED